MRMLRNTTLLWARKVHKFVTGAGANVPGLSTSKASSYKPQSAKALASADRVLPLNHRPVISFVVAFFLPPLPPASLQRARVILLAFGFPDLFP